MPTPTATRFRDQRLDVWRGLCLVDVVLVHLAFAGIGFPEPLDSAVKHWFRFAAGGFVFLAGMTVATVFAPQVRRSPADRRRAYQRLWRRAALLAALEIGAALAYRLIDPLRYYPTSPAPFSLDDVVALVLWQRPGVTGGILLLYALILGAMPAVFEVWRRFGNLPIALASAGLYVAAVATDGAHWPRGEFPVIWWQPIFFAGFLSADVYASMRARPRLALAWAMGGTAAFMVAFLGYNGPSLGITIVAERLPLDFAKNPLRPGALLWYLAITQVVLAWTQVAWQRLDGGRVAGVLALLGRHSLLVYTAHVFTEVPVLEVAWVWWPSAAVRTALAGLDLVALVALCVLVESRVALPSLVAWSRELPWARLARVGATAAAGAAIVSTIWLHDPNTSGLQLTDLDPAAAPELRDEPAVSVEPGDAVSEEPSEVLSMNLEDAVG
ncbi:MAG: OpgC domain-containing protein [bacterium]|nr:OpgC domain-containing protein [bacterium]